MKRTIFPNQATLQATILKCGYPKKHYNQAKRLAQIISKNKKTKLNENQIRNWCFEFEILVVNKKIDIQRINKALKWYSKNIGKERTPHIYSGKAFRRKFFQLEQHSFGLSGG